MNHFIVLAIAITGSVSARSQALLTHVEASHAVQAWHERNADATLVRHRFVSVAADLVAVGRRFDVDLLGDRVQLVVTSQRPTLHHTLYDMTIAGRRGTALFAISPSGVVAASIETGHKSYTLEYSGHGTTHRLAELDQARSTVPGCAVGHAHEVAAPPSGPEPASTTKLVDVAVFYTPRARSTGGGKAAIEANIALRVANATKANITCNVPWEFRLVYVAETNYTETGGTNDLSRFRSTTDSYMREVHAARTKWGADLMALITQPSRARYCGVGYLMTRLSTGFKSAAFSVTLRQCLGGHTLSHEMGHNCGSHHDRANAGRALYPYSYGYRTSGNVYRSIMAYRPGSRVNQWSSATVKYRGKAIGTVNDDNARSLTNAGTTLGNFYPTRTLVWCELKGGVAGQYGVPTIAGAGTVQDATTLAVSVGRLRSGTVGLMIIGGREINTSVLGGVLVPSPDVAVVLAAKGLTATFDAGFMASVPSGTNVWFQGWFLDAAAKQGFSATNGLKTRRP